MRFVLGLLVALAPTAAFAIPAGPQLADGSFESPVVTDQFGFTYNTTGAPWTFNARSGIAANGSAFGFANAPDGNQIGLVQSYQGVAGAISQLVTGLVIGQTYTISFDIAARQGFAANAVDVSIGSTDFGTYTPQSTEWSLETTGVFTASASSELLSFTGQSGTTGLDDLDSAIDAVKISTAVVGVPEPITMTLMATGLLGLGLVRRKRG